MTARVVSVSVDDCDPNEVRQRWYGHAWWLQLGPVAVFLTPELLAAIHAATGENARDRE